MYSAIIGMKEISQRVKDKNFKELKNKPLFAWIIDSLLVIDRVDEIVINIQGDKLLDKVKMYYPDTHKIKVGSLIQFSSRNVKSKHTYKYTLAPFILLLFCSSQ